MAARFSVLTAHRLWISVSRTRASRHHHHHNSPIRYAIFSNAACTDLTPYSMISSPGMSMINSAVQCQGRQLSTSCGKTHAMQGGSNDQQSSTLTPAHEIEQNGVPLISDDGEHIILSTLLNDQWDWLEVAWKDYFGRYPYVWLRDNCPCTECFNPSFHQRSTGIANLDLDVRPNCVELTDEGQLLRIKWSDKHCSTFPAKWLKLQRFDKTDFDVIKKLPKIAWGSDFLERIPTFDYNDIMRCNKSLLHWMNNLITYGMVMIKGSPQEGGIFKEISERIAFPRFTCLGQEFRVDFRQDSSSLAYSANELGLHIDMPYYAHRPCVQLLHCIRPCKVKGGENQFADAKRVVERFQQEEPELFEVMTSVKLDFRLLTGRSSADYVDSHLQQARPLIELDDKGQFKTIAYNDQVRAPYMNIPVELVAKVYKALKKFHQTLYSKDNIMELKLQEGDMVAFDNNRVLHGRSAYPLAVEDGENTSRLLEGGYLNWDELYSRMRVIHTELHGTPCV